MFYYVLYFFTFVVRYKLAGHRPVRRSERQLRRRRDFQRTDQTFCLGAS